MTNNILKGFVERITNLEEDKRQIGDDIAEIYTEAEGKGFDKKALRRLIKDLRNPDEAMRVEQLRDDYLFEAGFENTPLGKAANKREPAPA
jgi:uncharacterized protein (UPF0335 family)